jgi:hypothetical protein
MPQGLRGCRFDRMVQPPADSVWMKKLADLLVKMPYGDN